MMAGSVRLGLAMLTAAIAVAAMGQPSAAQVDAKPADAAGKVEKGRTLFADFACGNCHSLSDAGATGHVGPSFDGNHNLTEAFVVSRVTSGQGGMPAFGDQMTPEEISAVAAYVTQMAGK